MPTTDEIEMLEAALAAGITSRSELANLMAQVSHESSGLTRLEEGFRYTRGVAHIPVQSVLREGFDAAETARIAALAGRPQELARLMYGGRLGNDDAGDGYLYRGRGYIQLTGEANYLSAGDSLNLDLVNHPELAANRLNAVRIALWHWSRVPEVDRDDVTAATYAVNGGDNGLQDRFDRFDAWHALLTPEFVADLEAGRIPPGRGIAPATGREPMADGALRRFETGADVRQLQNDLHTLGVRNARGHEIGINNSYGASTEQAVRRFQEDHGFSVTGRAGPETLTAVHDTLQQRLQQQLLENPADPHMRLPDDHRRPGGEQEPPDHQPQRDDRVQSFPTNHRDYALFEAIRRQLPNEHSDDMAAHATLEAKRGGITRPDQIKGMAIENGRLTVMGKSGMDFAVVELTASTPPLPETLQQSAAFDRQQAIQLAQFQEQQQQMNMGRGPSMTL